MLNDGAHVAYTSALAIGNELELELIQTHMAQSHVIFSYSKFGSLGDVRIFAKHAVCDYVVMFLYSRFGYLAFVTAHLSGHPNMGGFAVPVTLDHEHLGRIFFSVS